MHDFQARQFNPQPDPPKPTDAFSYQTPGPQPILIGLLLPAVQK